MNFQYKCHLFQHFHVPRCPVHSASTDLCGNIRSQIRKLIQLSWKNCCVKKKVSSQLSSSALHHTAIHTLLITAARHAQAKLLLIIHGPRLTKNKTPSIIPYHTISPIHSVTPLLGVPSRQRWGELLPPGQKILVQPPATKSCWDSQARDGIQSIMSNSHQWIHFNCLLSFWTDLYFAVLNFPWQKVLQLNYLYVEMIFASLAAWWFLDSMLWKWLNRSWGGIFVGGVVCWFRFVWFFS